MAVREKFVLFLAHEVRVVRAKTGLTTDKPACSTKSLMVRLKFETGQPALGGSPCPMGFSPAYCTRSTASVPMVS